MTKTFRKIAGYDEIKEELLTILNWINNSEEYQKMHLRLPRGILFVGSPGVGKSLFMMEYARLFNLPILTIWGDSDNVENELIKKFELARKKKSILIIDELDLLLEKNYNVTRILQSEMDGLFESCSPFVLATCNNLYDIPEPLRRSGRFDRIIRIQYPDKNSRKEIFNYYIKKLKCEIKDDELDYLADICAHVSCADIMKIVNDCYLRFSAKLSLENLEKEYYILFNGLTTKYEKTKDSFYTATHESGHAIIAYKNKKYFNFYRATIESAEDHKGLCKIYHVNERDQDLEKMIANIEILLGGFLAQKLINKRIDSGSEDDLKNALYQTRVLVNTLGYKGIKNILREYIPNTRNETDINNHRNEKLVRKLIMKIEKNVKKYIKQNREKLNKLSNYLYENGTINKTKFTEIMEEK